MLLYKCASCGISHPEPLMLAEQYYDEDDVLVEQVMICPNCENNTFSIHFDRDMLYSVESELLM